MTSSAAPGAERTPDPDTGGSSAGSRLRRWRRGPSTELDELDEDQAAELVRRSGASSRDAVSAASAEIAEDVAEDDDEHVVIEVPRWAEPGPTAEERAALEAQREAAEAAAAAATERVIAQAIATGLTDPDQPPDVRRGLLRRRTGYTSPAPAHPAGGSADPAPEHRLPRHVRRELERATRELTEAAAAAHTAREAAEQAAAIHAAQTASAEELAARSAQAREAAERAAGEHAAQARAEAQRRAVAEELASETVERMAAANAERLAVEEEARRQAAAAEQAHLARAQAEEAALRASTEREAAEAEARAQAQAAARASEERAAAEARAEELAASLEEARAARLEQTRATLAAEQAREVERARQAEEAAERVAREARAAATAEPANRAAAPEAARETPVAPPPAAPAEAAPQPAEPRIPPEGVPELVRFRSPGSSAVVTVLLGLAALAAAAVAVYEAYLDRLTTAPGLVASAVTLLLVVVVGRTQGAAGQVWLEHGVLHIEQGEHHRRFDLTTPHTKVEVVGRPGERRWKVLFLRKGMAPYEITARLVEPEPFLEALRPWRPTLGG